MLTLRRKQLLLAVSFCLLYYADIIYWHIKTPVFSFLSVSCCGFPPPPACLFVCFVLSLLQLCASSVNQCSLQGRHAILHLIFSPPTCCITKWLFVFWSAEVHVNPASLLAIVSSDSFNYLPLDSNFKPQDPLNLSKTTLLDKNSLHRQCPCQVWVNFEKH